MCGIASIFKIDPSDQVDPTILNRMTDALRHRGPDDAGHWICGPIGLGHRRLSIIDLSAMANQPMSNEDGTIWIAFNGEIYNFKALYAQLLSCGHVFRSH